MTKFKKNDRVEITAYPDSSYNGFFGKVLEPLDQYGYVELALESVPFGHREEWQTGNFYVHPNEITLAKQETKVTEFKDGDRVRILDNRNAYGERLSHTKEFIGREFVIEEPVDVNSSGEFGNWTGYGLVNHEYWVRSDDIELVSRKEEPLTAELTSDMIDWEEILFGNHETEGSEARYKIVRIDDDLVSLKIKKDIWWTSDDLIELGSHILALAEYLETGTVDLSDDCIECENEHLRDSNERLASANEAKRQRLAKIRELTEV